ncbi:MAG TPA: metal-dependent transcriptional regulator [Gemmatimonadaceae bacterium]|jgi:DtxR family Mn-dependent transcriptional regulator
MIAPRETTLTRQAEDYLKVIYEIEQGGAPAGTTDVAAQLGVAAASVSGMLLRLSRLGLVKVERYRGARLSPRGRTAALQLLRRHRVIESFLVTKLGYGWAEVHEEAERLEHAASAELIDRMADALGNPAADPHGAPIPTAAGRVDERRLSSIADLAIGDRARVVRMSDRDAEFLRYLAKLGIVPGVTVRVAGREPFNGPITLVVGRSRRSVGAAAAGRVYVDQPAR